MTIVYCDVCFRAVSTVCFDVCFTVVSVCCDVCFRAVSTVCCDVCFRAVSTVCCDVCFTAVPTVCCDVCFRAVSTVCCRAVCPVCCDVCFRAVPTGCCDVLFTLYSQPLSDVISVHNCDCHKYADVTDLSKIAPPDQFLSVQSCIQTCIDDVLVWMNSNKLKLNTDKTEVMPVGSASCLESVDSECANIGGNSVPFKTSVKYFGVHLDKTLSMQKHISSVTGRGECTPDSK